MVTVFDEYPTEEQHFIVRFLWTEGLNVKNIHQETFPVYNGKYFSREAVHNLVANVSLMMKRLKRRCGSG
jgi:hypothetical protein